MRYGTRSRLVWMATGAIGALVVRVQSRRASPAGRPTECRRTARHEPGERQRDAAPAPAGVLPRARIRAVLAP
jgi:hypothetical protein